MIVAQTRPTPRLLSRRLRTLTTSTLNQERDSLSATGRHHGFAQRRRGKPAPPSAPEHLEVTHNELVAPVRLPHDPHGILHSTHASASILANSTIVVQRKLELMNVLAGFEQANRYVIMDGSGEHIGYMAERDHGIGRSLARQAFRTHRSFTAHVFDREEVEVLRIHRPFSWINSKIKVYDALSGSADATQDAAPTPEESSTAVTARTPDTPTDSMRVIGESQQQWSPLRRKYNLFLSRPLDTEDATQPQQQLTSGDSNPSTSIALATTDPHPSTSFTQFAYIDSPFLSWDFTLLSSTNTALGDITRSFRGLARELFTDTGAYALRMESVPSQNPGGSAEGQESQPQRHAGSADTITAMTLDQRAVMLATAISVDFDYFSRHSGPGGGGFFPLWFPMGGGGAEAGAEAGAAEAGAGAGAAEGGVAGEAAGAGEAAEGEGMWGGDGWGGGTSAGPGEEEVWGESGGWGGGSGGGSGSGGGGDGGGDGGGGGFDIGDLF